MTNDLKFTDHDFEIHTILSVRECKGLGAVANTILERKLARTSGQNVQNVQNADPACFAEELRDHRNRIDDHRNRIDTAYYFHEMLEARVKLIEQALAAKEEAKKICCEVFIHKDAFNGEGNFFDAFLDKPEGSKGPWMRFKYTGEEEG